MSSINPYEAPREVSPVEGILSGSREDLLRVAKAQKGVLICILVYIGAVIAQFAVPPESRLYLAVPVVGAAVGGAIFVFLLAIRVYGHGLGILFGLLTLVPLVGLLVLLKVNGKATNILKQNGIGVGLLGANLASIETRN